MGSSDTTPSLVVHSQRRPSPKYSGRFGSGTPERRAAATGANVCARAMYSSYHASMKEYFKHQAESEIAAGASYIEITDGWSEPAGGDLPYRVVVG